MSLRSLFARIGRINHEDIRSALQETLEAIQATQEAVAELKRVAKKGGERTDEKKEKTTSPQE